MAIQREHGRRVHFRYVSEHSQIDGVAVEHDEHLRIAHERLVELFLGGRVVLVASVVLETRRGRRSTGQTEKKRIGE